MCVGASGGERIGIAVVEGGRKGVCFDGGVGQIPRRMGMGRVIRGDKVIMLELMRKVMRMLVRRRDISRGRMESGSGGVARG